MENDRLIYFKSWSDFKPTLISVTNIFASIFFIVSRENMHDVSEFLRKYYSKKIFSENCNY